MKKSKTINRVTLESHSTQVLHTLHLLSDENLHELLREYQLYNTGLGAYNEMIKAVEKEILKR